MSDSPLVSRKSALPFSKTAMATAIAVASGVGAPEVAVAAQIEEIVVTAARRAQTTQEVPYSISAYDSDFLVRNYITDINEASRMVPGLSFIDQGGGNLAGANRLVLRGLNANAIGGTGTFTNNTVAPVSTYLGETPVFYPITINDLERVEVLRGPQGTLYGSGSLGGTIRFIPKRPDPTARTFSLDAATSFTSDADDPNYNVSSVINLPVAQSAALRFSLGYREDAGFVDAVGLVERSSDNYFTGVPLASNPANPFSGFVLKPEKEDVNDSESWFTRGALLIEPSDRLSILLSLHHEEAEQDASQQVNPNFSGATIDPTDTTIPGSPGVNVVGCPGGCFGPETQTVFPATGDYDSTKLVLDPSEREIDVASLEIEVDMGFASLTSATSYYDQEQDEKTHGIGVWWAPRGLAAPNLAYYYGFYPRLTVPLQTIVEEDALVQELRLVSSWDRSWDFVAGAFYQDLDYSVDTNQYFPGVNDYLLAAFGFPGANPQLGDRSFDYDKSWNFEETALFGELTYHLNERWQVTAGARFFRQEFSTELLMLLPICGAFCANDFADPLGRSEVANDDDLDDEIFKFNTSYDINEDTMVYFNWSEGFRRGGPNGVAIAGFYASLPQFQSFEADKSTNMELGIKGSIGERMLYSAAIYRMDWEDFQLDTGSPAGWPYVANGEEARTQGIELEFSGQLTDRLWVSGGYAYTDAEATESFTLEDATVGGLFSNPPSVTEFTRVNSGDELPGSFEHSATLAIDYSIPLENGMLLGLHLNGFYRSDTVSNFPASGEGLNFFEIDGFSIWDGSISLGRESWTVDLFVNNLTNEEGISGGLAETVATSIGQYRFVTRPRTVGLRLRYTPNER